MGKNHVILVAEKALDKIQHAFLEKNPPESRDGGNIPQHHKGKLTAIYGKLTANIVFSGGNLRASPLRSRTRGMPTLTTLFNIVLEVLASEI